MITFTANVRSASARSDDAITTSSVGIPIQLVLADEFMGLKRQTPLRVLFDVVYAGLCDGFIALGIAILTDGLFKIRIAAEARSFGIGSWWLTMLLAVLTAAVGLVLIFRPTESRETMTVLLGLSLLAEGGLNLAVALSTVKIVKNQYPDVIEGEFTEKERDAR